MNSDFSRVISLLRKERGISQKKAAADLGVSQGLLSHYEKGKRECGLDFLVKTANYYNVSCDYLLGRSPEPEGKTISVDELPESDPNAKERLSSDGVMVAFYKKLILNSTNLLFSILQKTKSQAVIREVSSYIMLSMYKMFRHLYSSNPKNNESFFSIDKSVASLSADAAMAHSEAQVAAASSGVSFLGNDVVEVSEILEINTSTLAGEYPQYYSSFVNLIKNSEAKIQLLNPQEKR